MNIRWTILVAGIVGAALGFMLEAPGPIGKILWPMADGMPEPEGTTLALLMGMGLIEAIAFGAGAAFLVAAWPWVKARRAGAWSWPVYLAVAWSLMNWVPHTSLHMNHGNIETAADFGGLAAIEYGFHATLMVAAAVLGSYVVRSVALGAGQSATKTVATSTAPARKA